MLNIGHGEVRVVYRMSLSTSVEEFTPKRLSAELVVVTR